MLLRVRVPALVAITAVLVLIVACREITAPEVLQKLTGNSRALLNPSGVVVVYPDSMRGWAFYNDQTGASCPTGGACRMVQGPAGQPLGAGSAELADSLTTDGKALILQDYAGTRFDQLTDLHYSTYRQSVNPGNNLAISLQFNADYDLSDAATGYQGRIVFEPYVGIGGNVPQNTWQTWDAKAGKWWGTRSTVSRAGMSVANPCVQATPCTWAALLTAFPNIGVHSVYAAVVLKAGSGWPGFRGDVDKLVIGIGGIATTFDFELAAPSPAVVPFPDTLPSTPNWAYLDALPRVPLSSAVPDSDLVVGGVIMVTFKSSATTADKQFVRDSLLHADLLGAWRREPVALSTYYFKVRDNPSVDSLVARDARVDGDARVLASEVLVVRERSLASYRIPTENPTFWSNYLDPLGLATPTSTPANGLNLIRAPLAWGCATGNDSVRVSIYDNWFADVDDLRPNLRRVRGGYYATPTGTLLTNHGERVAAILAAAGNNGRGMSGVMWNAHMEWMGQYSD